MGSRELRACSLKSHVFSAARLYSLLKSECDSPDASVAPIISARAIAEIPRARMPHLRCRMTERQTKGHLPARHTRSGAHGLSPIRTAVRNPMQVPAHSAMDVGRDRRDHPL